MPDTQTILMLATGVFLVLNGITGANTTIEDSGWPTETADQDVDDVDGDDPSNADKDASDIPKTRES